MIEHTYGPAMDETDKIWLDGVLVDWSGATIHVGVHGLHYGSGVFEGIRCYDTPRGPAIFRLEDHLRRLHDSARLLRMEIPFSVEQLCEATCELVRVNGLDSCYIRPISFYGYGSLGVAPGRNPVVTAILCWPWGAYLGEDSQERGITAKISTWERVGPNVIPHTAKATGIYLNSMLATMEARDGGYQEAILLAGDGTVADGPGETIFVVKDGVIRTPPLSSSILAGITRDSVITLARGLGYPVEEARLVRSDLLLADEVLMTGTAAEVTPVRSVDDVEIGVGEVTRALQQAYQAAVTGLDERHSQWLRYVAPVPQLRASASG